ncbi:hypothetical protein KI387_036066 [Taxus chinensis]|uniref:Uncharacterized protein n=1 Tax=Taxus chinensis TaxID=29808 RepID=A0AA38FQ24_TAXCH|nr:hypothetical protein KI387_036066 [Taxus chinensis]
MTLDNGLLKTLLLISVFFKGTSSRSNSNISSVKGIRRLIACPTLVSSLTLNKFGQEIFLSISFKLLIMTAPFLANLLWWWVSVPYVNKLNKKNPTINKGSSHDYLIMMMRRSAEPSMWYESYFTRAYLILRCTLSHHNHNRFRRVADMNDSHNLCELFKANSRPLTSIHCHGIITMGGQLKRIELASCTELMEDQEVWNTLKDNGVATFLERMSGYSATVSYSALATWSCGRVQIGNTSFTISTNAIASMTSLPASGVVYFKRPLQAELQDFIDKGEKPAKYLSSYVRESLLTP